MSATRGFSFRARLLVLCIVVATVPTGLVTTTSVIYQLRTAYQSRASSLESKADILAANSRGALAFHDDISAAQTLESIKYVPGVTGAWLIDVSGDVFAASEGAGERLYVDAVDQAHRWREGHWLVVQRPVALDGETIGAVQLQFDMSSVYAQLVNEAALTIGIGVIVLAAVMALAVSLQRALTRPVTELCRVAQAVTQRGDYAVRAKRFRSDELGDLTDAMNDMLDQVQIRDRDLERARDRLETQVLERTRDLQETANSLKASETRVRDILESASEGILTIDAAGKVGSVNQAACRLFACEADEMVGREINDFLEDAFRIDQFGMILNVAGATVSPLGRSAEVMARTCTGESIDVQIGLSDSRADGGGRFIAVVRDVSDRRRAERERDNLNQQLMTASRQAGMAEVATGVLHNVGNVLNSVNVSANLLLEGLSASKVSSLRKTAALIKHHAGDLAAFMTEDERGKLVPGYLGKLADLLERERCSHIEELKQLSRSIDHMKEVISTQQSYAKSAGVSEQVALVDLVEDAIRINQSGLTRHRVEVRREFGAAPTIRADKHKIVQILVNLISNAKHAMADNDKERILTVRTALGENDSVRVQVIDNGHGIESDHLTSIFSHGFTTRKDGHGFGLHSGALAATELGGQLSVDSDGRGCGAVFTLDLPAEGIVEVAT